MSGSQAEAAAEPGRPRTPVQVAADIVLFFAAPFITLAYCALFPFIAVMMLTRRGDKYWRRWPTAD